MKLNKKRIILSFLLVVLITFGICRNVYAVEGTSVNNQILEYSDEYKKWLELPEKERNQIIQPRMYNIPQVTVNKKSLRLLKANNTSKYNLKDIIPENVVIRDQKQTNTCWAFSTIAALESTLGLQDYNNGLEPKMYDFSERHMEYATSRTFLNGEINTQGFTRKINSGGNPLISIAYLTNGMGAISEEDMEFENNTNLIELSKIQNKTVTSKVIDTVDFPSAYNDTFTEKEQISEQIKNHIKNYGGVMAAIHGAQPNSVYYNSKTGAIYCDDVAKCPPNHQILIIGWDDEYEISNFNSKHQPENPGAWIIKNSWGTSYGNEGIMYVSYEDVNIYYWLAGIQKASNTIDYDNIYQYNEYGYNMVGWQSGTSKVYFANEFEKKTEGKEYLTEVSLYAPENYTCKVYVNVNGTNKSKDDLTKVKLKEGESETFGVGYHTIEFAAPIEILADNFVIIVEAQSLQDDGVYYCLETNNTQDSLYQCVEIAEGKCFMANETGFEYNSWYDLSDENILGAQFDSTIKAFTIVKDEDENNNDEKTYLIGDINGDAKVSLLDYGLILAHVKRTKLLEGKQLERADVNGDNKVTLLDYGLILAHVKRTKLLF